MNNEISSLIYDQMISYCSEVVSTVKNSPKQLFLGLKDTYSKGGNYNYLKEKFRLTPKMICEDIKKNLI